jgi:hypothetical protein
VRAIELIEEDEEIRHSPAILLSEARTGLWTRRPAPFLDIFLNRHET